MEVFFLLVLDEELRKDLAKNGQMKASRQFDLEKQYQKFFEAMI